MNVHQSDSQRSPARVAAALLLLSVAMLMYEILQTITLSLQTIERNAFLVVSLCLLGLGGGGSVATLLARRREGSPLVVLWLCAAGFAVMSVASMILSSWTVELPLLILLGVLPYLPLGIFLSVVFRAWPADANRLYCFNLTGSALGCLLVMVLVGMTGSAAVTLVAIALLALIAALLLGMAAGRRLKPLPLLLAVLVCVIVPAEDTLFRFTPAPTKGMALILEDERIESEITWSRWGYLGRLDVLRPGKGIEHFELGGGRVRELLDAGCGVQYLFASGGNWTKAVDFSSAPEERRRFRDQTSHSIAYLLTDAPDVLNIGFGGGVDIFLALQNGARSVVGVEINPLMVEAGRQALPGYFDDYYNNERVEIEIMDGRTYVRTSDRTFDVISLTAVDTGELLHSNAHVLLENYLYTQEAFDDYIRILNPDGFLYVSRPHIQAMRLIATAVRSLRAIGVTDPEQHIIMLGRGETRRSYWRNVLIARKPFTPRQKHTIVQQYRNRIAYLPGAESFDPLYRNYFNAVANDAEEQFMARQEKDFSPVTDDRPFFYEFSRDHRDSFAGAVLLRILRWVTGIAAVLILLPLFFVPLPGRQRLGSLGTVLLYFAAIGLGFMFVEICLIQKLVLFLGHPSYSVTVTLFSILIFSGLGSIAAKRFETGRLLTPLLIWLPILAAVLFYGNYLDRLLLAVHSDSLWIRFLVTALLLAPGSFFMGMPFPTMIRFMEERERRFIPWAWAINAFTSVASSVLTVYLAIQYGFHNVLFIGAAAYLTAMLIYGMRILLLRPRTGSGV